MTRSNSTQPPSAAGRLLYSGILVYMAVDGFKNNEKRVEISRSRGVPLPEVMVPLATGLLLVANLGIVFWKYPRAATGALIVFFLGTTPAIHNFWTMDGAERQQNKINFCKNIALIGGAVTFFREAAREAENAGE
ncbi:DoxX family protein [Natronorubrum sp. FCH18a]|uniref:DoxX family protein n=1 Tax=Natronorubrum sp. FCH18a TaxID=3447018 RepID=UPI003F51A35E